MKKLFFLIALITCIPTLFGCGSSSAPKQKAAVKPRQVKLLLDFTPNAAHAGIYAMSVEKIDRAHGLDTQIQLPGSSGDSIKLLLSNKVNAAVLDIHDLAIARERGKSVVGIVPIVQRPLASLLAQPGITSPRDLVGKRVGVSGLPSDEAVLASIVRGAGGNSDKVKKVTIGFNAVASMLSKKVAAATAFWNVEGLALQTKRRKSKIFKVDDFGAPSYPELVLCVTENTLKSDPKLVSQLQQAVREGYGLVGQQPQVGVQALHKRVPTLKTAEIQQQLKAISPAFKSKAGEYGVFDQEALEQWATWEQKFGIVKEKLAIDQVFWLK